tara:strand:+ start:300 stop:485 length:186 start_codon:yes stop_codon:yes gene_type:complete
MEHQVLFQVLDIFLVVEEVKQKVKLVHLVKEQVEQVVVEQLQLVDQVLHPVEQILVVAVEE